MKIPVPAVKRDKPAMAPEGIAAGTVKAISMARHEGQHRQAFHQIDWTISRDGETWELPQICETDEELADVLVDLGLAGQEVEPEAMIGLSCVVEVAHFAGHKYARVVDTLVPEIKA